MLVTAYSDREKMLFFIGIHICYITLVMVASFLCNSCVTRKIRLCLHPYGMLRVQSLHTFLN